MGCCDFDQDERSKEVFFFIKIMVHFWFSVGYRVLVLCRLKKKKFVENVTDMK